MKPFLRAIMKEIWVARGKEKASKRKSLDVPIVITPSIRKFAMWAGRAQ
jgi:hypothetical protein